MSKPGWKIGMESASYELFADKTAKKPSAVIRRRLRRHVGGTTPQWRAQIDCDDCSTVRWFSKLRDAKAWCAALCFAGHERILEPGEMRITIEYGNGAVAVHRIKRSDVKIDVRAASKESWAILNDMTRRET